MRLCPASCSSPDRGRGRNAGPFENLLALAFGKGGVLTRGSATTVTYAVGGRQYIAVVASSNGIGNPGPPARRDPTC